MKPEGAGCNFISLQSSLRSHSCVIAYSVYKMMRLSEQVCHH